MSLAVVDTTVVILLLSSPGAETEELRVRRERTELAVAEVLRQGGRLVVPTPVIAELARTGSGAAVAKKVLSTLQKRCRFEGLDIAAAEAAGVMRITALTSRAPGSERGAIPYDALIAGIAHARSARWLLTANPRDFEGMLKKLGSPVEVVVTDALPKAGQLSLVHQVPKGEEPTATPDVGERQKPKA